MSRSKRLIAFSLAVSCGFFGLPSLEISICPTTLARGDIVGSVHLGPGMCMSGSPGPCEAADAESPCCPKASRVPSLCCCIDLAVTPEEVAPISTSGPDIALPAARGHRLNAADSITVAAQIPTVTHGPSPPSRTLPLLI